MRTLVIIPAYNEEESLERTINNLTKTNGEVDFLIVNDGSKDATERICRVNNYPFLNLPVNLGLAGAFQAGMKYALKHDYDCAIQFDADGQHLPEYINTLASKTTDFDIVIGSRFANSTKPASLRMLGSWIIEKAIRITTGKIIRDPTSGMRAFNARMIEQLALELNLGPEPDTLSYLIRKRNAQVAEVPVEMQDRFAGESYLNLKSSIVYMLRMTMSILFVQFFRK